MDIQTLVNQEVSEGFNSPKSNNSNLDFSPQLEVWSAFNNITLDEVKQDDHTSLYLVRDSPLTWI